MNKFFIGIDPGTNTGLAIWNSNSKQFVYISTMKIHNALETVLEYVSKPNNIVEIVIEDPTTWIPFNKDRNISLLQGAGSIKRDFAIWVDFCKDKNIIMNRKKLQGNIKKLSKQQFKTYTDWIGSTSVHARDAAMLVWQL